MASDQHDVSVKHYELLYVIPVSYTADELTAVNQRVRAILAEHHATVTYEDSMGKRKLAYPIQATHHGYYFIIEFDADTQELVALNTALRLAPEVLRHLIVAKKEQTATERQAEKDRRDQAAADLAEAMLKKASGETDSRGPRVAKTDSPAKAVETKVDMEALDKKLDELIDTTIL